MRGKTKKATFNLHTDVLAALDEVMTQGIVPSKNALVEQALVKELKELQRQARQTAWQKASKDPLMLKDIENTETGFKTADAETARRIV
jgi:rRNA-processing protein FCF1